MPTIPANNNTGLYNTTGNTVPTDGNISTNNISASGNVTVGGYIIADGSITTNANFVGDLIGNVTGNVTLAGGNTEVIFNNNGVTGSSPNFTFNSATNVLDLNGNLDAAYFIGNGSQLTGLPASYGNANVAAYLPTFTGNLNPNTISASGNVTGLNLKTSGASGNITGADYVAANFFVGDGSLLTNLPGSGTVTQVQGAGAVSGLSLTGNVTTTGNLTLGGTLSLASVTGNISTTGNITGGYIFGNGSQLTGIAGTYGNAEVAAFLPTYTGAMTAMTGNVTTTANIAGSYFIGNGSQLTGITAGGTGTVTNVQGAGTVSGLSLTGNVTTTGNLTLGGTLDLSALSGNISTTGNVSGAYITGNGTALSSITGANVTGTVSSATTATTAGTVTTAAQGNITSVGTLTSLSVSGNITSSGNVVASTVQASNSSGLALKNAAGTTQASLGAGGGDNFAINVSTNLNGTNAQIDISPTGTGHVHIKPTGTGAVEIAPTNAGTINNMVIGNATPLAANFTTVSATGNIAGSYFIGNGSQLTGITSGGSGTVTNVQGNGVVSGLSLTGNVTTAGNLTLGGTLDLSSVSGNISTTGNISGGYILGNGSALTGVTAVASPGGSNTQIQFNDAGSFAGNAAMLFNNTTGNITLGGNIVIRDQILNTTTALSGNSTTTPGSGMIIIGNGYAGDYSNTYFNINAYKSRLAVYDQRIKFNNGRREAELGVQANWDLNGGTISNAQGRVMGITSTNVLQNGTMTNGFGAVAFNAQTTLGLNANTSNACVFATVNYTSSTNILAGSGGNIVLGYTDTMSQSSTTGNVRTHIGYVSTTSGPWGATPTANIVCLYNPSSDSSTTLSGGTYSTDARTVAGYWFLKNEDTLAQCQLGSLRLFSEYRNTVTSSAGAVTINKSNGQVQYLLLTEDVTAFTFSNFIVSATVTGSSNGITKTDYQTDTVTLVIRQDATGRAVTLPSGTGYRYSGGASSVDTTPDSVTMVSITAITNAAGSGTEYLITVSPGFV